MNNAHIEEVILLLEQKKEKIQRDLDSLAQTIDLLRNSDSGTSVSVSTGSTKRTEVQNTVSQSNAQVSTSTMETEAPKGKRGRPRKNVEAVKAPDAVKDPSGAGRGRPGRPRLNTAPLAEASAPETEKKRPGRPRLNAAPAAPIASEMATEKRRPGRPRLNAAPALAKAEVVGVEKKRPGRPRLSETAPKAPATVQGVEKKRPGRPRLAENATKASATVAAPASEKKRPGRPRLADNVAKVSAPITAPASEKKRPGRPRLAENTTKAFTAVVAPDEEKKRPGRPRLNTAPVAAAPVVEKKPQGRPRKDSTVASATVSAPVAAPTGRRGRPFGSVKSGPGGKKAGKNENAQKLNLKDKIINLIRGEGRFLHNREITDKYMKLYNEKARDREKLSRQISAILSFMKKDNKVESHMEGDSKKHTFWGFADWKDTNRNIKPDRRYRADQAE